MEVPVLKTRCENCTRLIVCAAVKADEKAFCTDACRENWSRAMRRFQAQRKPPLALAA